MAEMIDFENLTGAEVDALDGFEREAWYEFARGNVEEAERIMALYDHPAEDDPRDPEPEPEPPELTGKALQEWKRAQAKAAAEWAAANSLPPGETVPAPDVEPAKATGVAALFTPAEVVS